MKEEFFETCDICGKKDNCYIRGINYCSDCYKKYNVFWVDIFPFIVIVLFILGILFFK